MRLYDEVARHGGLRGVEIEPAEVTVDGSWDDHPAKVSLHGYRNVLVCFDGHRIYPTTLEQQLIAEGPPLPRGYPA